MICLWDFDLDEDLAEMLTGVSDVTYPIIPTLLPPIWTVTDFGMRSLMVGSSEASILAATTGKEMFSRKGTKPAT
jgi:hypothetical protein